MREKKRGLKFSWLKIAVAQCNLFAATFIKAIALFKKLVNSASVEYQKELYVAR
jgi:hypothetical protein